MTQHLQESQNKNDSLTNTTILTRRLCVCFACCLCFFISPFFLNATTTKIVNFDKWFESLESYLSIISNFLNLWIWMSRHMWFKYISNVMSLMWTLYSSYSLQSVLINQCCGCCYNSSAVFSGRISLGKKLPVDTAFAGLKILGQW